MVASIVASVGLTLGATSLAYPPASAAGHLALLWDDLRWDIDDQAGPDGWDLVGHKTWMKRLKGSDLGGSVPTRGTNQALLILAGAGRPKRKRDSAYARLPAGGVGFWLGWMSRWHSAALASSTYQIGSTLRDEFDDYRHGVWARAVSSAGDYTPGDVSRYTEMVSLVVPPLGPPAAPLWLTTGQSIDRTQLLHLQFAHESEIPMDRCRVEVRATSSGTWQYVTPAGTLSTTSTEILTSSETVTIAAGVLAAAQSYEMRVFTHDDGGWSPTSVSIIIVARNPPAITGTLTVAHNDLSPLVTWSVVPSLGQQRSWQVRIAPEGMGPDAALDGWSSGVQAGSETSWQAPASNLLINGGSYAAWVKVSDDALTSPWIALPAKIVSWTPPPGPASLVTVDSAPPTVTAAGVPATSLALEWQAGDGESWTALASTAGPAETETIFDPLAPFGVARYYRVRSIDLVDGVQLPSEWTTSAPLVSHDTNAYLVSPGGTDWMMVRIVSDDERSLIQGISATQGVGTKSMHTQRTLPAGESGTTVLSTWTQAELARLVEWVSGRSQWWLRWPPERESGALLDVSPTLMGLGVTPSWQRKVQTNTATREVTVKWVTQEA